MVIIISGLITEREMILNKNSEDLAKFFNFKNKAEFK